MVKRILVLEQTDPKKSTGLFDPQVFKGGNSLSAVTDPKTAMWYLKMERGLVPGPLRSKYTSLNALLNHARDYFAVKSIIIKEVIHCPNSN